MEEEVKQPKMRPSGIWERMFDPDQRVNLTGAMAKRHRQAKELGEATDILGSDEG